MKLAPRYRRAGRSVSAPPALGGLRQCFLAALSSGLRTFFGGVWGVKAWGGYGGGVGSVLGGVQSFRDDGLPPVGLLVKRSLFNL